MQVKKKNSLRKSPSRSKTAKRMLGTKGRHTRGLGARWCTLGHPESDVGVLHPL